MQTFFVDHSVKLKSEWSTAGFRIMTLPWWQSTMATSIRRLEIFFMPDGLDAYTLQQPAGLEESKRKSDWARTDFDDFEGQ